MSMHSYANPAPRNPFRAPAVAVNQDTLDRAALFDKEADRLERQAAEYRRKAKEMRGER